MGGGGKLVDSERATLVFLSFHGSADRVRSRARRAHTGDLDGARKAIARMRQLRDATKDPKFDYFKSHLDLQMQAASAWVAALKAKRTKRRYAAAGGGCRRHARQTSRFARSVCSRPRTTRRSAAGNGQPKEAQREFEAALKIYPGRFRGLYGAAQAAEQTGDKENAGRYYAKLAAQTSKADGSREELKHIREFLSAQAKASDSKGVAKRTRIKNPFCFHFRTHIAGATRTG